jgi:hypothetical protein
VLSALWAHERGRLRTAQREQYLRGRLPPCMPSTLYFPLLSALLLPPTPLSLSLPSYFAFRPLPFFPCPPIPDLPPSDVFYSLAGLSLLHIVVRAADWQIHPWLLFWTVGTAVLTQTRFKVGNMTHSPPSHKRAFTCVESPFSILLLPYFPNFPHSPLSTS